jgi:hypothetical protein
MDRLKPDKPDNTRTCPYMSDDTETGQTRTYAFRHVQMSGVRSGNKASGQACNLAGQVGVPPGYQIFSRTTL